MTENIGNMEMTETMEHYRNAPENMEMTENIENRKIEHAVKK